MKWYLLAYHNYAVFGGRAGRTEYWMFTLINTAIIIVLSLLAGLVWNTTFSIQPGVYLMGTLIPWLAVAVRRLHDTGRSGRWMLVGLIPLAGPVWLVAVLASAGDTGPNPYGQSPKHAAAV